MADLSRIDQENLILSEASSVSNGLVDEVVIQDINDDDVPRTPDLSNTVNRKLTINVENNTPGFRVFDDNSKVDLEDAMFTQLILLYLLGSC
jgi:hypothetical protein